MEIPYIDRKTGQECVEKVYGHKALSLLYGDGFWRSLFSFFLLPLIARVALFSHWYGFLQKRPRSRKKIAPFIEAYGINTSEFATKDFASFNDFFIRKLKPEKRPIVADPNVLAMPADGRYFAYERFDQFVVKGQDFSLLQFLDNNAMAHRYCQGAMAIVRLCPVDYHRFHFPCEGVPSRARLINGPLFSVNPMALRKRLSILSQNKRMITEFETKNFGTILYIEIGATAVGSIHQTYESDKPVQKGQEKGYFDFGGSCLVLLFEKGRIAFDADLISHTKRGFETRANFGESLARSLRAGGS